MRKGKLFGEEDYGYLCFAQGKVGRAWVGLLILNKFIFQLLSARLIQNKPNQQMFPPSLQPASQQNGLKGYFPMFAINSEICAH